MNVVVSCRSDVLLHDSGLNDPKPLVVGIAWVVECAERKAHVDETKYLVSLENENVAGTNKVCG